MLTLIACTPAAPTDTQATAEAPVAEAVYRGAAIAGQVCAQCHGLEDIDARPPTSADEVKTLILRMIAENGLEASRSELDLVYLHMVSSFAGGHVK